MKKIPTLFVRDPDDRAHVLDEVNPESSWVLAGEGTATRKYDGTCVMLDGGGKWWARREVKPDKEFPANYVVEDHDPITGKWQGWEPIEQSAFAKFHAEALGLFTGGAAGTYELVGPKINGNPDRFSHHRLMSHDRADLAPDYRVGFPAESTREVILAIEEIAKQGWEGIVWHHPDGRMAKLKVRDIKTAATV